VLAVDTLIGRLAVALGIGLVIGLERERRKGSGPSRGPAGVRTFALTSLAGALSLGAGGESVLVAAALFLALLTGLAYRRSVDADPGLTTEMALLTTLLLGALAIREPAVASGAGVVVAILLASRRRLHRFIRGALTEQEVHDVLLFAAAALVVLPLAPDRPVGPYGSLNPRTLWRLVVLLLGIQGAGHVAVRALGARVGLPLAGLASGFVSSAAALADALGDAGILLAATIAGFVDAHAAAISVASLVSAGRLQPADAVLPIVGGLATNTLTKVVLAITSGGSRFAWRVVPGLIAVIAAAGAGLPLARVAR
jgi:uncharacterized membrane protein (DUF4010 family)